MVESVGGRAFVLRVRSTSWFNFQGTVIVFDRKNTVPVPWGNGPPALSFVNFVPVQMFSEDEIVVRLNERSIERFD